MCTHFSSWQSPLELMMAARINFAGRKFILKCYCKYEYSVEVLAWLLSLIPMGLIDLFVGLSQANPNPIQEQTVISRSSTNWFEKRMAQVKTIIFFFSIYAFYFEGCKPGSRQKRASFVPEHKLSPLPIRQSFSHEPREAFYEVSLCQRFSRLNLEGFSSHV